MAKPLTPLNSIPPHTHTQGLPGNGHIPDSQPDPDCSLHPTAGEELVALPWERPQL